MKKYKVITLVALIMFISWMGVIFLFSNQPSKDSISLTAKLLDIGIKVEHNLGFELFENRDRNKMINEMRQAAHFILYGALSILGLFGIRRLKIKGIKSYVLVIVLCLIFAFSDEYHQRFVQDRTSDVVDIYFDMAGVMVGCAIYFIGSWVNRFKRT